jgi:hypothetical protein
MGFGIDIKVDIPKVDAASTVNSAKGAVTGVVSGAVDSAKSAVTNTINSAKNTVSDTVVSVTDAVSGAVEAAKTSLSTVAGAITEVAVSFTGAIDDLVLEPHLLLDANANFGLTNFEKGPILIRVEHTPDEAKINTDTLHIFSESGAYDKTQKVSDFSDNNGKTVTLLFKEAPMNEKYSLEVIHADGGQKTIFTNIAYGDLRKTKQRFV